MLWHTRRNFLKSAFIGSGILLTYGVVTLREESSLQMIQLVQEDLFPHAKSLGIRTDLYLALIFDHSRVYEKEKEFLRNGVQWLSKEALKMYQKSYVNLSKNQREDVLHSIAKEKWGKQWINKMLTYIMEATFSDRVYGVCKNEAGTAWLHFEAGVPRPKEAYL